MRASRARLGMDRNHAYIQRLNCHFPVTAMKSIEAMKTLLERDTQGRSVFSFADPCPIFPHRSEKTLTDGLRRLARQRNLERAERGAYANPPARSRTYPLERIAATPRRGAYSYVSLETAYATMELTLGVLSPASRRRPVAEWPFPCALPFNRVSARYSL